MSRCVYARLNATYLCVTVCVLWEEFVLFAVNTAHNGALKSEALGLGKWRASPASNDYTPLPSGQNDPILMREKNAIDPDLPQNNQINSFCPLSAMTVPVF